MYSDCLAVLEIVLRKINSSVWFIQTFLKKMLYIPNFPYTSSTVNMPIMNQFHTHSQKKQNPAKKFIKSGQIEMARRRRRWDRAVKATSSGGEIGAIVRPAAPSTIAIAPLVGCAPLVDCAARSTIAIMHSADCRRDRPSLSLIWALSSLSLSLSLSLSFSGSEMKWKWRQISFSVVKRKIRGQPEMIFRKITFSVTAKHRIFRKIISGISLKSIQTHPKC